MYKLTWLYSIILDLTQESGRFYLKSHLLLLYFLLLNHIYPTIVKQVVQEPWELDLIVVHQVNLKSFFYYRFNFIIGGGGGGFFSNFFPGGSGGFGGSRPSAPPPPGFRPGFTDNDNYGPGKSNISFDWIEVQLLISIVRLYNKSTTKYGYRWTWRLFNRSCTWCSWRLRIWYSNSTVNVPIHICISSINYSYRPDTQYMPGTANTGWFGGGTTTHRNNSSSSSSNSTYTSSGEFMMLNRFLFTIKYFHFHRIRWHFSSINSY